MNSNQRCCDVCEQPWGEHIVSSEMGGLMRCPTKMSRDLKMFRAGEASMRERAADEAPRFDGLASAQRIRALPLSDEVPK